MADDVDDGANVEVTQTSNTSSESDKNRSAVWKFFEKKTDKTVTCTVCSAVLKFHGGTSSMKEHLKRKHPVDNPYDFDK